MAFVASWPRPVPRDVLAFDFNRPCLPGRGLQRGHSAGATPVLFRLARSANKRPCWPKSGMAAGRRAKDPPKQHARPAGPARLIAPVVCGRHATRRQCFLCALHCRARGARRRHAAWHLAFGPEPPARCWARVPCPEDLRWRLAAGLRGGRALPPATSEPRHASLPGRSRSSGEALSPYLSNGASAQVT